MQVRMVTPSPTIAATVAPATSGGLPIILVPILVVVLFVLIILRAIIYGGGGESCSDCSG